MKNKKKTQEGDYYVAGLVHLLPREKMQELLETIMVMPTNSVAETTKTGLDMKILIADYIIEELKK